MPITVVIAGASGALGRHVAEAALQRGHTVIGLVRDPNKLDPGLRGRLADVRAVDLLDPRTLEGACAGADVVFSAVGASVQLQLGYGWRGYMSVDVPANTNLLDAAKAAGVRRFVYVSTHHAPEMKDMIYVRAHEQVVEALKASGLEVSVLRPTGFFSALALFVDMAAKGPLPEVGDGSLLTNPIHDLDLAEACVDAMEGPPVERTLGGPELLSRHKLAELAFEALGRPVRVRKVPAGMMAFASFFVRRLHPRIGAFMQFLSGLGRYVTVAPTSGRHKLADYFREYAQKRGLK